VVLRHVVDLEEGVLAPDQFAFLLRALSRASTLGVSDETSKNTAGKISAELNQRVIMRNATIEANFARACN
jgi:hypothetical protein